MPKYIIEREVPGGRKDVLPRPQKTARESNNVLKELGPEIQWVESFVTDNKLYCVYIAPSEEIIRQHAIS